MSLRRRNVALVFTISDVTTAARRIILETDSTTVSSRVSRPRPDATEIQINEQTIMNAYSNLKERVTQRILQGGL